MAVVFTPYAERQLDELHRHIADQSFESRADAYVERLVSFCQGLDQFPQRGAPRDDILPGLRTAVFARNVPTAYLIDGEMILIQGLYGRGRDYEHDLR